MFQLQQLGAALGTFTDPLVLLCMFGGFLLGVFFAAVPGLTGTLAIALLLPITFGLPVEASLVMCAAIFMGGQYGGSITAIAINIPGAPCSVMTAYEGNKLMRKGFGPMAMRRAALASAIGGVIGGLLLLFVAPIVSRAALYVQTPGKFALILFALIVVVASYRHALIKGAIATVLGLMLATIGIDVISPVARQTFGSEALIEGIDLMAVIIGAFAVAEVFAQVASRASDAGPIPKDVSIARKEFVPRIADFMDYGWVRYLKSSLIGYFVGVLPGAGGSAASFISYADARRSAKRPEDFGNGSSEGVAGAECANNAMCGGAFVPMLTFGIPGDGTTAVILGVLIINGLQPGPQLFTDQYGVVVPMMIALIICALLIPLTLIALGRTYLRLIAIDKAILFTAISVIAIVGAYISSYSSFQMATALVMGVTAFVMSRQGYPSVCLLLGFILGPDLEVYFRRALSITEGNPIILLTSPDSLALFLLTIVFVYMMLFRLPKKQLS